MASEKLFANATYATDLRACQASRKCEPVFSPARTFTKMPLTQITLLMNNALKTLRTAIPWLSRKPPLLPLNKNARHQAALARKDEWNSKVGLTLRNSLQPFFPSP
ncbi:MAG: hypothetical protein ACI92G_000967 [Candidatus Pelagisphaera sp.]|jgi:hypothetical protein